jgi:outer membrane lipoprotein-sorting protein
VLVAALALGAALVPLASPPPAAAQTAAPAPAAEEARDPWAALTAVRRALIAGGPTAAEFTQRYVPAGFTTGEEEGGRLALSLPDCLRWDYTEPYSKSFLLCGSEAFYWNPDDGTGRRYPVDREREPGLDLLLLGVDELAGRYTARVEDDGGRLAMVLTPRAGTETAGGFTRATLAIDPTTDRLVEISYLDAEGNRSSFTIGDYRPLAEDGLFTAPDNIVWQED